MATQITNVYIKKKNDTEWTELEKVFENGVLKFQKSPVKDAYYDYTRVALVNVAMNAEYYSVQNTSNYTVVVTFTNGVMITFAPGDIGTYSVLAIPARVKIGDNPTVSLIGDGAFTWYNNNVPYKYHPAEYIRELYVN
jgi:hypothetical protein